MGAAGAGAIVQGLSDMGGNMINSASLAYNKLQGERNFAWQQRAGMANLILQGLQWNREDTAIQRRVADLKAAGLSPVLAAGSGASSSEPMRVNAPQNPFTMPMNAIKTNIGELIQNAMLTQSQVEKNNAETQRMKTLRMLDLSMFPYKLENINSKTKYMWQQALEAAMNNEWYKKTGINKSSSEQGRFVNDLIKLLYSGFNDALENYPKGDKK